MLSPEVWNFPAPDYNYKSYKKKFDSLTNIQLPKDFQELHYAHIVSAVIPNELTCPESFLQSSITDFTYYEILNVSVSILISEEFINLFVKEGQLSILSLDTRIDVDNCVCFTSNGKLILNLTKNTYQELGIDGKVSKFASNRKEKYVINLDVLNVSSNQRKKLFLKLKTLDSFKILLNWQPNDSQICPSSIAKYFHDLKHEINSCDPKTFYTTMQNIPMSKTIDDPDNLETFGAIALQCDVFHADNDIDSEYLHSWSCDENADKIENVTYLQWRGFFTPNQVNTIFDKLKEFTCPPWTGFYVQGFSDSPVNFNHNEQQFNMNGDNFLAIFFSPRDQEYLLCVKQTSTKKLRHKLK